MEKTKSKLLQVLKGFNKGFLLLLVYELIEEAIEEAIAWTITTVIARAVSFILVVLLTQTTKVSAKAIVVVLKPVIKKLTYKKGGDKMDKIKSLLCKLKVDCKNNPIMLCTVLFEALLCGGGGFAIDYFKMFDAIPQPYNVVVCAIVAFVIFVILAVLTIYLGYDSKAFAALRSFAKQIGCETCVKALDEIKDNVIASKEAEKAQAEELAKKKAEEDRIIALYEAEQKAQAEAAAKEEAKAEEARIEAERQAKIAAYKASHSDVADNQVAQ